MFESDEGKDSILDGGAFRYTNPQDVKPLAIGDKVDCVFVIDYDIGSCLCRSLDKDYEIPPNSKFTLYQTLSDTKLVVVNASNIVSKILTLPEVEGVPNIADEIQEVIEYGHVNSIWYNLPNIIVAILVTITVFIIFSIKGW